MNDLVGSKGDIFWDLPPVITYLPGSELGCVIYVANPTDSEKEYALIGHLYSNDTEISEEAVTVYGYSWFKVDPGDFIRLHGALTFSETEVTLTVSLIERESDTETNRVSTFLAMPEAVMWPPGWPGAPTSPETGFDWSSLLMLLMFGVVAVMMIRPSTTEEKGTLLSRRES